ncbi:MAG: hypothetical protein GC154_03750 [bacterium]|nr:hypothetical protein [bacterium]
MIPLTDSAVIITNDQNLAITLNRFLFTQFGLDSYSLTRKDAARVVAMNPPLFCLWDGRVKSPNDASLLRWLREHFHGRPIIVLVDADPAAQANDWYSYGISMICRAADRDSIVSHIEAVLKDNKNLESALPV